MDGSKIPEMTPSEAHGLFVMRKAAHQDMDVLAWRIGGYTMRGFHAPRRYPRKPSTRQQQIPDAMTEEEMKRVFFNMAQGGKENGEKSRNTKNCI